MLNLRVITGLKDRWNNRLYDGYYYPTIGYKSQYTNRFLEMVYTTTFVVPIFGTIPFNIKCRLKNPILPFRRKALQLILDHDLKIMLEVYDSNTPDKIKSIVLPDVSSFNWIWYKDFLNKKRSENLIVLHNIYNDKNQFIGTIDEVSWIIRYGIDISTLSDYKVRDDNSIHFCVGFIPRYQKWCGWGRYAVQSFGIGDALFNEKATVEEINNLFLTNYTNIDEVPFKFRGKTKCQTLAQSKIAACNFAKYMVS